jgi:hypothetical protein
VISRVAALALCSAMLANGAAAESIKVATWNMNNLHHVLGEPLRDRAPAGPRRTMSSSGSTVTGWAPIS